MPFIKITQPGMETYTGDVGSFVSFVDGVSTTEPAQKHIDKIAAIYSIVLIEETGKETETGLANRLVTEAGNEAPVAQPMQRQSGEEKAAENRNVALLSQAPLAPLMTRAQLELVADNKGIKGLRTIAAPWGIKNRSIPIMILQILDAQAKYLAKRDLRMQDAANKESATVAQDEANQRRGLFGSNTLASSYEIGGKTVSLGQIVVGAQQEVDLSVEAWNALSEAERDEHLNAHLTALQDLAAVPKVDPQSIDQGAIRFFRAGAR